MAALREELVPLVEAAMQRWRVPGVALGLLHSGERLIETFGVTSVEDPRPVDGSTYFQIGSTTKTFTATLLLQLADQGRIDLDAPIVSYLPDLPHARPDWRERLRVRHLLTHRAGWDGDWFLMHPPPDEAPLASLVERLGEAPALIPPGAGFSYSNLGFALAGVLIERISEAPFGDVLREGLLRPLGLDHTRQSERDLLTGRVADGHIVRDDVARVARPRQLPRAAAAHGALIADLPDQLAWAAFWLGNGSAPGGRSLLQATSFEAMRSPQAEAGSICDQVGFAWLIENRAGVRLIRHGGETHGQMCAFWLVPECDFAVVVMTNADTGARLHQRVVDWLFEELLGLPPEAPSLVPTPETAAVEGRYSGALRDVVLSRRDDSLWLQPEPKRRPQREPPTRPAATRLGFVDASHIVALDEPSGGRGELLGPAFPGASSWLRWDGRLLPRSDDVE